MSVYRCYYYSKICTHLSSGQKLFTKMRMPMLGQYARIIYSTAAELRREHRHRICFEMLAAHRVAFFAFKLHCYRQACHPSCTLSDSRTNATHPLEVSSRWRLFSSLENFPFKQLLVARPQHSLDYLHEEGIKAKKGKKGSLIARTLFSSFNLM